jgi:zinc/manganese transport system permease protein
MVEASVFQGLSWNLLDDVRQLFAYPFMVNALEAGTIVAVMAGVTGWFMVLRRQAFAGHTLSVIAFPARRRRLAAGAVALGYFGFCGAGARILAAITARAGARGRVGRDGSLQALAPRSALFVSSRTRS